MQSGKKIKKLSYGKEEIRILYVDGSELKMARNSVTEAYLQELLEEEERVDKLSD